MKKHLIIWIGLFIFCHTGKSQHKSFDLNYLLLQLNAQGDSAIRANNFILAEKFLIKACSYTDTLILCLKNPDQVKNRGIIFSNKKTHLYMFAYENLGSLYMMAGNIAMAEEMFNKSVKQREAVFNKRSVFRVYPYIHLGQLYFQSGNFDKALEYFSKGSYMVDHATTTGFNFDMVRYQLYGLHFEASLKKRRMKEAYKYLQRYYYSLNTSSPTSEQIAAALEMKARYYLLSGEMEQAALFLQRAEKKFWVRRDILSQAEIKTLRTKALYYWNRNFTDSAAQAFENLLNSYERNIRKNFSSMSEYEREQFYVTLKADFDLFNSFVASELKANKNTDRLLGLLYNTQLFSKALLLNEITKIKTAILSSGDINLIAKINEWEQAKDRIAWLHYNHKDAAVEINALEKRINTLEKEISEKSSLFAGSNEEIQWQQIRDVLKEGEAAIEIIRARSFNPNFVSDTSKGGGFTFTDTVKYIFLIVRPGTNAPQGFILENGNRLEGKLLAVYRNSIRYHLSDFVSYTQFWKPVHELLKDCSQLYVSTDGVYNQINLNVLQNPQSQKYMLDEMNIVFVTNTKDLLIHKNMKSRSTARLYGHPTYSLPEKTGLSRPTEKSHLSASGNSNLQALAGHTFADLPGTQKEIDSIAKILNASHWNTDIFLHQSASEENIKSMKSPDVLHIATHGFFLADEDRQVNSMIRSGIVLSGVKSKDDGLSEDGILTAYEATNLSLDSSQLVVLSACETGLGEIKNGEGVYGLQRGLKVAGASNILMSLWKVDDAATSQLMIDFYKAWLGGTEIHAAFRQAQLSLRKKYPSPFYWGAFILLGN
ncbi:MAG: CHAT domain-containing protein [Cytophagaceae bacterium]|nr:CHAT domain-containing protein [Cytophagaceae bacterium]